MRYPGKEKCEALKSIRQQIAQANGIAYSPHPCTHQGDCPGTCPACEAEVQYLEREIIRKHGGWTMAKGASAAAGIVLAAGMMASCSNSLFKQTYGDVPRQIEGDVPTQIDSIAPPVTPRSNNDSLIEMGEVPIEIDEEKRAE